MILPAIVSLAWDVGLDCAQRPRISERANQKSFSPIKHSNGNVNPDPIGSHHSTKIQASLKICVDYAGGGAAHRAGSRVPPCFCLSALWRGGGVSLEWGRGDRSDRDV